MTRLASFPVLLLLIAAGCAAPASMGDEGTSSDHAGTHPAPTSADLGDVITLERGSSVIVDGHTVRFDHVTEDSRCPADVQCVWEGRASVSLSMYAGDMIHSVLLSIPGYVGANSEPQDMQKAEAMGHSVTLLQLDPYPGVDGVDADMTPTVTLQVVDAR